MISRLAKMLVIMLFLCLCPSIIIANAKTVPKQNTTEITVINESATKLKNISTLVTPEVIKNINQTDFLYEEDSGNLSDGASKTKTNDKETLAEEYQRILTNMDPTVLALIVFIIFLGLMTACAGLIYYFCVF